MNTEKTTKSLADLLCLEKAKRGDFSKFTDGSCRLPFKNHEDSEEDIVWWTVDEVLDEINRDRTEQWSAYGKSDWQEGLKWTEYGLFLEWTDSWGLRVNGIEAKVS